MLLALGQINGQRYFKKRSAWLQTVRSERYWTYNVSKMKLRATVLLAIMCVFSGRQSDREEDAEMKLEHPYRVNDSSMVFLSCQFALLL